jgi:hypothetical protein
MSVRVKEDVMKKILVAVAVLSAVLGGSVLAGSQNSVRIDTLPTVEEVLHRYIEAMGGREALEKLETRICVGRAVTDLTSRQHAIYESHYFKACSKIPTRCYTEEWSDNGIFREGFDGRIGWVKNRCGVRPDERIGKWRLHWLLNPQNALRIEEYYPDLEIMGTRRVRGMVVYALESPAIHRPLFFDVKTGLLVGFGHNWEIHDYREVDGVLFPYKVVMSRKGGSTTYAFTEVRHNVEIDDSVFVMPAD